MASEIGYVAFSDGRYEPLMRCEKHSNGDKVIHTTRGKYLAHVDIMRLDGTEEPRQVIEFYEEAISIEDGKLVKNWVPCGDIVRVSVMC